MLYFWDATLIKLVIIPDLKIRVLSHQILKIDSIYLRNPFIQELGSKYKVINSQSPLGMQPVTWQTTLHNEVADETFKNFPVSAVYTICDVICVFSTIIQSILVCWTKLRNGINYGRRDWKTLVDVDICSISSFWLICTSVFVMYSGWHVIHHIMFQVPLDLIMMWRHQADCHLIYYNGLTSSLREYFKGNTKTCPFNT